jgi:DNA-binding CsgD family transcriptional regulator
MKNGAVDFLTKPVDAEQLAAAVSRGMERSRRAQADRQSQRAFLERLGRLTPREREVAMRLVRGLLNREIASELGTTEKTVKVHRGRVMAKLEVGSVAQLVRLLEDRGRAEALPSTYSGSPGPVSIVAYSPRRGIAETLPHERSFETRRFHSSGSQPKWRSTC